MDCSPRLVPRLWAGALVCFSGATALAQSDRLMSEPVLQVVATRDVVLVETSHRMRLLSPQGLSLGAIDTRTAGKRGWGEAPPQAEEGGQGSPPVPTEDDRLVGPLQSWASSEGEDLREEESSWRNRRRGHAEDARLGRAAAPVLLASAGQRVLLLTEGRLVLLGSQGVEAHQAAPPSTELAANRLGEMLILVHGEPWFSQDGGLTWLRPPVGTSSLPASHLALDPAGGGRAWLAGGRLIWNERETAPLGEGLGSVQDLRFCSGYPILLTGSGVWRPSLQGEWEQLAGPLGARRLVCGEDPRAAWFAVGPALLSSMDQGRSWHAGHAAGTVHDAALCGDTLWLATSGGLLKIRSTDLAMSADPPDADLDQLPAHLPRGLARSRWAAWLPRVSLGANLNQLPDRVDLRAFALASFPTEGGSAWVAQQPAPLPTPPAETGPTWSPLSARERDCLAQGRRRAVELAVAEPARGQSLLARAARSAWLPELRLRYDRRLGRTESLDAATRDSSGVAPVGLDTVAESRYEARATWDLSRLIFNPDEVAAMSQALRMADMRREIESLVNRLYFERRRLIMEKTKGTHVGATGVRQGIRVEELTAELEALSGGAMGVCYGGPAAEESSP